jgi:hypothetical protein
MRLDRQLRATDMSDRYIADMLLRRDRSSILRW